MTEKIFRSIITVTLTVLLTCLVFTSGFLYDYFNSTQVDRLKEELSLACTGVEQSDVEYFGNYSSSFFRFTLVSPNGDVRYDSQINHDEMENHINREEIKEALENGSGSSARYSSTLTERTLYEAVRLSNGDVLRIGTTQLTLAALIIAMLPVACAMTLFSAVIAVLLSRKMAKSIVKPLEELDLEHPDSNDTYEELTPILSRLNRQRKQIMRQVSEIKQRDDEFGQIINSMNEGLILLDRNAAVLSINNSAKRYFSAYDSVRGKSILTLDRSAAMSNAVERALNGKHEEFREQRNGREFQFLITPTLSCGEITGVAVLCIDITEAAFAERNRREFTANVSHELKTPLQSIIGSAELLENGLVKKEDTEKFVGNIKKEAVRLVALINDIIRLSRLDEEAELPSESVDLCELANQVTDMLSTAAKKKSVTFSVNGDDCVVKGVKSYIYEIIYNLCDNAVRYNKEGGSVTISLKKEDEKFIIEVSDTGIGIPAEHQARIFERFYRVDKSHSRETGGTGLGLSIVKHAAAYHGGTTVLKSREGFGTTVTVTLFSR